MKEDEAELEVPGTHALLPAYPNPFNPVTNISLVVAREQHVRLEAFDVTGRHVETLFEGILPGQTRHTFRFEAANLPGGLYVIRAIGESFNAAQPVMLVK